MVGLIDVKGESIIPRPGYTALQSQLRLIRPSSAEFSQYAPTITPIECQNFTSEDTVGRRDNATTRVYVATPLPQKPSKRLCECMLASLSCIAASYEDFSTFVNNQPESCNQDKRVCAGVDWDSNKGTYGAFSACNYTEQRSWTLNQIYVTQNRSEKACKDHGGIYRPTNTTLPNEDCRILLDQAGPQGTGTVTYTPTAVLEDLTFPTLVHKSLSPGAKIGVIISSCLIFIILLVTALLCYRHKQRRKLELQQKKDFETSYAFGKSELEDSSPAALANRALRTNEVDGSSIGELPTDDTEVRELETPGRVELDSPDTQVKAELSAENPPFELEGQTRHLNNDKKENVAGTNERERPRCEKDI
jgi:X8 domain-containing protein